MGFLLVPGFALMSYAAAIEPLRAANLLSGQELYRWWHAAPGGKPVVASNGVAIIPDCGTNTERAADIVFVCAGGNPALFADRSVFAWLRRLARKGAVIGGISGGPYLLAKAGLLDERRATLHWEHLPAFREAFPDVAVVPSLFEIDGNRITCSGGISALDMMVAIIEKDHGRPLAAAVGDWFLHTHVREGFGPQRMDLRYRLGVADEKLLSVLRAMEASIETPLSARLSRASGRHFAAAARAPVPPPYRPRHPPALSLAEIGAGAPALARDDAARARRGARHRLCFGKPIRPRLYEGLRRAAEPHPHQRVESAYWEATPTKGLPPGMQAHCPTTGVRTKVWFCSRYCIDTR